MHPLSKTIADDIRRRHSPTTGSRPATDTDPIDNDGATTPPPVPAVSSPRCGVRSLGSSLVCDREPHTHGLHECGPFAFSNDFYTPTTAEVSDGQVTPHHAQPVGLHRLQDAARSVLPDAAPETALEVASTLSPAPATSETSAPDKPDSGSLLTLSGAPPAKLRAKKAKPSAAALDIDTWGRCCQAWDAIRGKPGAWKPEAGMGRQIAEGIGRVGAARMEARLASVAAGTSPAGRKIRAFFDAEGADLGMLCWERGAKLLTALDGEIEQATLDAESRSEAVVTSGGMLAHPSAQNAPERQPAPKQTGSAAWDDMLSVIRSTGGLRLSLGLRGSTLSHDAGEHKRRCQAVADIGGWAKLCEMGEHNRGIIRAQFVAAYDRAGVSA